MEPGEIGQQGDPDSRLKAVERVLDGILARMGVPNELITEFHHAAGTSPTAAIGAANRVNDYLTQRDLGEDQMCGRFAITLPAEAMRDLFRTSNPLINFPARYNAAPTQDLPVIRFNPETGQRALDLLRWGLVPRWAQDTSIGMKAINARCETMATKPMFKAAFEKRRCLVPMTAFYEWQRAGTKKVPHAFGLVSGDTMAIAGLWERWRSADGEIVRTFTVVTGPPNDLVHPIHDRMPVILPPEAWALWLGEEDGAPDSVLAPYPAAMMRCWRIGDDVGNVRNEGPALLEPMD